MAAKHIRVLLPRNTQPDHDVEEFGGSVLVNVYNNKNFTALAVDQPMLQAALRDFAASIAATVQGGSQATNERHYRSPRSTPYLPARLCCRNSQQVMVGRRKFSW